MNNEDKQLLLKDLCARLPYGVKCHMDFGDGIIEDDIMREEELSYLFFSDKFDYKPYLRSMGDFSEEERLAFCEVNKMNPFDKKLSMDVVPECVLFFTIDGIDWLNAHHYDFRRLIHKGLALKAPKGMYDKKKE